jgi:flagellar biosynthesis protein FlhB
VRIKLGDVFTEPFKIVGKNPIILIPFFIGIILTLLFDVVRFMGPLANLVSSIIIGITTMFFIAWVTILFDQYKKGEEIDLKNSLSQINQLLLEIIVLSIVVGFLISLGTLAYVIPGLILALFLIFSPCALVIDKLSVTDSLKKSYSFVFKGENFLQIFLLLLVIFLLGMIPIVGLYLSIILEYILLPYIYVEYSK